MRQLIQLRRGSKEERLFYELGCAAIRTGQIERLEPFGFREPDILFYLDSSAFVTVGGEKSWAELDEEWRQSGMTSDLKSWLCAEKGARITTNFVANVARTMPLERRHGKEEFDALVALLRA